MGFEFALAIFSQFQQMVVVLCVLVGTIWFILGMGIAVHDDSAAGFRKGLALVKQNRWIVVLILGVLCVPSLDDLWKVRINLVKLQLASPANVERGAEVIERVAKELECSYLKHCDDKGKSK